PRPANSQVSRARCIGLQRTSPNAFAASTGRIRSASRRPLSVNGMSVVPVCWPLRLHAVSPCLIANTFTFAPRSNVVGPCRTDPCESRFLSPPPTGDLGHIVAVSGDELLMLDELVADRLLGVSGPRSELRHAVDHVAYQVEAIEIIQHAHVERRRGGALFLVATHMDVIVTGAPVGQSVNQPRVAMEGKDDRLVGGEQRVEIVIREAMRVLARGLQRHEIDYVDDAYLQIGSVPSKEVDSGKGLQRRHVTAARHHDIGLAALVVAGPLPDAEAS